MSTPELKELLERVRKAEGPDREIDARVWAFQNGMAVVGYEDSKAECFCGWRCKSADGRRDGLFQKYARGADPTSSLDACLSLMGEVLPGWRREVDCLPGDGVKVSLTGPFDAPGWRGDHNPFACVHRPEHLEALATLECIIEGLALLNQEARKEKTE